MTTLVQDVQALLATLAPAGGVWYGINTTEPPTYPYIVWQRIVSVANVSLAGPSNRQNTRVQIDIISLTIGEASAIETALEALMAGASIVNVPLSSQDTYEDAIKAFRIIKDFSLWATN